MTPLLASANNVWDVAILLVGLPARMDAAAPIGGIHPQPPPHRALVGHEFANKASI